MRYGVPYQGSKNKICDWLIEHLPSGDVFVDLFAGGCVEVASIKKQSLLSATNSNGNGTERLFVQERFFKKYNELMSEGKLF